MYFLRTEASFDAAHFLKDYNGKCKNLHGHRWKVVAEIQGETLSRTTQERGMLVDFGDLKRELKGICQEFDHSLIYEKDSLKLATLQAFEEEQFRIVEVPFRPTAENFSAYFYHRLMERGFVLHRVEVYETPNNCAAYEE